MRIDIMTLFPDMCRAVLDESIVGRARKAGKVEIEATDIRAYTENKYRNVDDTPYGGGMGMVMQTQPVYDCYQAICQRAGDVPHHLIYLTPQGKTLTQQRVKELAGMEHLVLLCGHYEGIDERVIEELQPEEISVGDYVLTGGELPALVLADSVTRLLPGVLSDAACFEEESHYNSLLEYPQYTRPEVWRGRAVPQVLLSGHHENIRKWRRRESLRVIAYKFLLHCSLNNNGIQSVIHSVGIPRKLNRHSAVNSALLIELRNRFIHGNHTRITICLHYLVKLIGFPLPNQAAHGRICMEYLKCGHAAFPVCGRNQLLGNYRFQHFGKLYANLLLFVRRKDVYHALHGICRSNGMQCGQNQMPRAALLPLGA